MKVFCRLRAMPWDYKMKITKEYIKNLVKEAMLKVPGVDTMPPGDEFVGPPSLDDPSVEERLARLESAVFGGTK
jgi:hypothetical protein